MVINKIFILNINSFELLFRLSGDKFEDIIKKKSQDIGRQAQADILFDELKKLRQSKIMSPQYLKFVNNPKKFTEFDMFLVQCAFFAGALLYPQWYGCTAATGWEP